MDKNQRRELPSIKVTAFGAAPFQVSFEAFAVYEVQDPDAAYEKAKDILRDGEADNGQEEHWAFQEYELYDRDALEAQLNQFKKELS